jgi:hypothetical protein
MKSDFNFEPNDNPMDTVQSPDVSTQEERSGGKEVEQK